MALRQSISYLSASLVLTLAASAAQARWDLSGAIKSQAMYTDNICAGTDRKGELIGVVTPSIRARGEGRRVQMDLSAAVEANSLDYDSLGCDINLVRGLPYGRDSIIPRLRANGRAELLQNLLFLDVSSNIHQTTINPFSSGGVDNISGSANRSTLYRYSVSPYLQRRWRDVGQLSLRYSWDEQHNAASVIGDSNSEKVDLRLSTDSAGSRFGAALVGRYQRVEYDRLAAGGISRDSEVSSVEMLGTWQLQRTLQLRATVGESFNDFIAARSDIDGTYWSVGFRWSPQSRTVLELSGGERFFGSVYSFNFRHELRRGILKADYSKNITFSRDLRGTTGFGAVVDESGQLVDPVTGALLPVDGIPTTITTSPLLNERANLSYTLKGRRSTLSFALGLSEQERFIDNGKTRFYNAVVQFTRQMTRNIDFRAQVSRRSSKRIRSSLEDSAFTFSDQDIMFYKLGLSRQLSPRLSTSLDYQFTRRTGRRGSDADYDENRIILGLNYRF